MSTGVPFKYTVAASTNLTKVRGGGSGGGNLKGWNAYNTAASTIFVKLAWYVPTSSAPTPVVGTTPVQITFPVAATTGYAVQSFPDGISGNGELWMWVTGAAADSDNTAAAANGLITLFVE